MTQGRLLVALLVSICGLAVTACSGTTSSSNDTTGGEQNLGWDNQTNIEAIFEANCAGCHSSQWSSCWTVQANSTEIQSAVSSGAMPRSGGLTASDKTTLLGWLAAGATCTGPRQNPTETGGIGGGAEATPTGGPVAAQ
jgi:hypothetical protein